jgi:hypothetical protein
MALAARPASSDPSLSACRYDVPVGTWSASTSSGPIGAFASWRFEPLGRREEVQEIPDLVAQLGDVAHREVAPDRVRIAAAATGSLDVAGFDEVGEDPLGRALGDPDPVGHVAQANVRVLGETKEHLRVIGDEGPRLPVVG